jgi:hypothetical protein
LAVRAEVAGQERLYERVGFESGKKVGKLFDEAN